MAGSVGDAGRWRSGWRSRRRSGAARRPCRAGFAGGYRGLL